jgi:hypothetical protein
MTTYYRAKFVAQQHIVELWRHPSAGFAASDTDSEIRPELVVQMGSAPDSILSLLDREPLASRGW